MMSSAMGGNTPFGSFFAGLPGILQGIFGDSGAPYRKAGQAFLPYYNEAKGYQNPFYNSGVQATGDYQKWLQGMSDPSGWVNKQMGNYQESPWANYLQKQATRAAQNMGSASGLTGSTPLMQQAQQNSSNIASGDMNSWLQNVMGINTQYGTGQQNLMNMGANAANILSQLAMTAGNTMGGAAYGDEYGRQSDRNSIWSGITKIFGG